MRMVITAKIFDAYLHCPTKFYLRMLGERGKENLYSDWLRTQNDLYRLEIIKRLTNGSGVCECINDLHCTADNLKKSKWKYLANIVIRTKNLESNIHTLERLPSVGRGHPARFMPVRYIFRSKLSKYDKMLLTYDAIVLSEMLCCDVSLGKIIHGDKHKSVKVKITSLVSEVRKLLGQISFLMSNNFPPDLILNRHCTECEFQARCRQTAIEKDELSLLAGLSGKARKKYNDKGIFNITQLSYTFRPRRKSKRRIGIREKYHNSLKALAIREDKIHIVGEEELTIDGTRVYLDVEGLPDREFYYLIGLRVCVANKYIQYSLWADTLRDEMRIWMDFINILSTIENPILIHYGSYEATFIKEMCRRYGVPAQKAVVTSVIESPINLLSFIYSRIYFPRYSNGLKDIANYLGFKWSDTNASGIQSILWRWEWEQTKEDILKNKLITYNSEDCEALTPITEFLIELGHSAQKNDARDDRFIKVDPESHKSHLVFRKNQFHLVAMEKINTAAYWNYQRDKILLKTNKRLKKIKYMTAKRAEAKPKVNKVIRWLRPKACLRCGRDKLYKHQEHSKTVLDVRFGRSNVKRWITKHIFHRYRCPSCGATFFNADHNWGDQKYGRNIQAMSVYMNIDLRIPQVKVATFINQMLGFRLSRNSTNRFKANTAELYKNTYERLLQKIVSGRLIHADETKVSVKGTTGYIWVFTSLEEVAYIYSPSREGELVQSLLKDFTGVLISDFYSVYDSINCAQQKCLIHLIRDLNDELLQEPFNEEIKSIICDFADLLKSVIETVERFGLKKHFLRKHKHDADRFFKRLSQRKCLTERAAKCKKRFEKNRSSLFTFLDYDGVPWNNNNAEHAIKALALLRRDFSGLTTEKGVCDYAILLSVCETCKFKGVNFFEFLCSGEKDIDAFISGGIKRRSKTTPIHLMCPE